MPRKMGLTRKRAPTGLSRKDEREIRDFFSGTYSSNFGSSPEQQALEAVFESLYGTGFHGGGVGGIDRSGDSGGISEYGEMSGPGFNQTSPFGNDWLGPDSKVYDRFGDPIRFRREVSPYMMYNHPEDPEMWDELPNPATPSRGEAGMPMEHMADPWGEKYSREYWNDRAEDLTEIADKERRGLSGSRGLTNILGKQRNRLAALRRRIGRGGL